MKKLISMKQIMDHYLRTNDISIEKRQRLAQDHHLTLAIKGNSPTWIYQDNVELVGDECPISAEKIWQLFEEGRAFVHACRNTFDKTELQKWHDARHSQNLVFNCPTCRESIIELDISRKRHPETGLITIVTAIGFTAIGSIIGSFFDSSTIYGTFGPMPNPTVMLSGLGNGLVGAVLSYQLASRGYIDTSPEFCIGNITHTQITNEFAVMEEGSLTERQVKLVIDRLYQAEILRKNWYGAFVFNRIPTEEEVKDILNSNQSNGQPAFHAFQINNIWLDIKTFLEHNYHQHTFFMHAGNTIDPSLDT